MNRILIPSIALAALLALAGCAKEIENPTVSTDGAAIELSSVSTDPMTKAVITGTSFTTDEAAAGIGLFLLDGSGNAYGSNTPNVKYDFNSGKWTAASPLRIGNTEGTLVGYYPYSETATNVKAIPVASSVNGTDYLYGSISEINSAKAKTESLTLIHALTRLRITFKLDASFVGDGILSSLTIEGDGVASEGALDATTGKITATKSAFAVSGLNASISTGLTEDCLVVPADAKDTPQAVTLKFAVDGKAYKVDLKDNLAVKLQSGIQTDITLTVKNTSVTVDGSTIGAWGEGGSQTVTVGGDYKVTVKLADNTPESEVTLLVNVEEDIVNIKAYSWGGYAIECSRDDNGGVSGPVISNRVHNFTISNITKDLVVTVGYITVKIPAGALPGKFTVDADGKQVYFSKGNLQATYHSSTGSYSWAFAANQYDIVGDAPGNITIGEGQTDGAVVSLFGWSSPATYYGIATSTNRDEYPGDFIDWGTAYCNSHKISPEDSWRTLSKNEWDYLLQHNKHGWATVNGICGLVIAPDGFEGSISDIYEPYHLSTYNLVFLPAESSRIGLGVNSGVGQFGHYYSGTRVTGYSAFSLYFYNGFARCNFFENRHIGCSVRLVTDVNYIPAAQRRYTVSFHPKYDIALDPFMVDAGATIAKPDDPTLPGYEFKGWCKDFNGDFPWDFDNDRVTKDIVLFPKWEIISTYNLSFNAIGCKEVPEQITGIPKNSTFSTSGNTLTVKAPDGSTFKMVEVFPDIDQQGTAIWSPSTGAITENIEVSVSFSLK